MLGLGNILTKGGAVLGFPNKYSFNFDASNDYLEIADNGGLGFADGQAFSVSIWFKTSDATSEMYLFDNRGGGGTTEGFSAILDGNATNYLGYIADGSSSATVTNTTDYHDGNWHHFAFTWDGTDTITSYIDGSSVGTDTQALGEVDGGALYIGKYSGGSSSYFNGQLDEFAIWNAELSANDIAKIASKPLNLSKASSYDTDRTSNLKLWLRAGDKILPEEDTSIARQDFYTDFDGTDDYVSVADDSSLALTTALSVSGWVNFASVSGSKTIAGHFDYPNNQRSWSLAWLDDTTNYLRFFVSGDGSSFKYNRYAWTPTVGQWYHLTATYNAGTTKLYIDGSAVTVDADSSQPTSLHNSTGALFIGAVGNSSTNADKMEGKLSSVSLYQTVLDAQTIKQFAKSRFTPMRDNRFSVVDFDGTNDHIVVSDNDALDFGTGDFTVALWHKSNAQHDQPFINKKTTFSDNTAGWTIYMENGNDQMRCRIAGGSSNVAVSAGTKSVSDKNWHFTTMVRSGDNLYLYTDGVLEGSTTGVNSLNVDNSDDLYIGRSGSLYPQIGVSSASLYNVAKSAEEVYAIYQKGITYDESSLSGLVGYWRMGDDTSASYPTIADSSSNSNDGTITNGASDDIVQQMVAGYDMGAFEGTEVSDTYPAIIDVNEPVLGVDLITNGDLESSSSSPTMNSVAFTYYNGSGARSTDFNNGGSHSYKFTGGDQNDHNAKIIPNDSSLVGKILSISVDVYTPTSGGSSGNIDLRVINHAGGASTLESTSTKDAWVNLSGVFVYDGTSAQPINIQWFTADSVMYIDNLSIKQILGNVGTMTNMASSDLVYSSVLPDQSFLTGVNSAYNFIDLDGSNEYIDCGDDTSLQITKGFTISCWAKLDSSASNGTIYIIAGKDASYKGWNLSRWYSNKIIFYAETGTPSNLSDIATSSSTMTDSNWHHYVGVFHGDGSTQSKIYIDGSDVTSNSGSTFSAMTDSGGNMHLGKSPRQTSYGWYGSISGTAIWNKALSATEVSAIYTLGRHGNLLDSYSDNLKGYWAMGALDASTGLSDVGNGTIYDRSGQSNHGTTTNTESADLKSSPNAQPNGYAKGDTNRSTTTP